MSSKSTKTIPGTCPRCGAPNHDSLRVCAYCGTVLVEDTVEPDSPKTPVAKVETSPAAVREKPQSQSKAPAVKKKYSPIEVFIVWTVFWAINCAVVVSFAPADRNRTVSFQILFFGGLLAHFLIEKLPWLTGKVLLLIFNLFIIMLYVIRYYPNVPSWLPIVITAAALIYRWRQLIRNERG